MVNIEEILKIFAENFPNPKIELNFPNEFTLLIAIILSAQTTDKRVNIVTDKLFTIVSTPKDILKLGEKNLSECIKTVGLFKSKCKYIMELSKILIEKYESSVPKDFNILITLPGVGRKTASVFLNTLLGEKRIAVDTHVQRLFSRVGFDENLPEYTGLKTKYTPKKIEESLFKIIPEEYQSRISNWLIIHGRYTCTAKKPKCDICKISKYCKKKFVQHTDNCKNMSNH